MNSNQSQLFPLFHHLGHKLLPGLAQNLHRVVLEFYDPHLTID